MLETREKQIGGVTYKVTQLSCTEGERVFLRVLDISGEPVAAFLRGIADGSKAPELVGMASAFEVISKRLRAREEDYFYVRNKLAASTSVVVGSNEPKLPDILEHHFAGKYEQLAQWLAFALEVNYSGFFGGSNGIGDVLRRAMATRSPSKSPSISAPAGQSSASQPAAGTTTP